MKWFRDGDTICITKDDFINLQESPALFYPRDSRIGETVEMGGIDALALGDQVSLQGYLERTR